MKAILIVLTAILLIAACDKSDAVYTDVHLEMSAAPVNVSNLARAMSSDPAFISAVSDTGFATGEFVSFSPSQVLITINSITLHSTWEFDVENNQYMGGGEWLVLPVNKQVDLVSLGSLNSIFDQTYAVSDTFFNSYVAMSISTDPDLLVSGVLHAKNMTYTMDDAIYTFGGIPGFPFTDTIKVDPDEFPTLRIIFDAEKTAYLFKDPDGPAEGTSSPIEDNSLSMILENALILPFEGTDDIELERYAVRVGPDYYYYVQVVLGIDQNDEVRLANWLTVFEPGFYEGIGTSHMIVYPTALDVPLITKHGDGSYSIELDRTAMPLREGDLDDRSLKFNSFRRENHSDTLIFGGTYHYAYTAEKL